MKSSNGPTAESLSRSMRSSFYAVLFGRLRAGFDSLNSLSIFAKVSLECGQNVAVPWTCRANSQNWRRFSNLGSQEASLANDCVSQLVFASMLLTTFYWPSFFVLLLAVIFSSFTVKSGHSLILSHRQRTEKSTCTIPVTSRIVSTRVRNVGVLPICRGKCSVLATVSKICVLRESGWAMPHSRGLGWKSPSTRTIFSVYWILPSTALSLFWKGDINSFGVRKTLNKVTSAQWTQTKSWPSQTVGFSTRQLQWKRPRLGLQWPSYTIILGFFLWGLNNLPSAWVFISLWTPWTFEFPVNSPSMIPSAVFLLL